MVGRYPLSVSLMVTKKWVLWMSKGPQEDRGYQVGRVSNWRCVIKVLLVLEDVSLKVVGSNPSVSK